MSGIEILQAIQSFVSPFWDRVFFLITELYSEDAYMALLPVLFLVVDKRLARYLATVFLVNHWVNTSLKVIIHEPRPPQELWRPGFADTAPGGGFPSGHAQGPLLFWGAVALEVRRGWVTALAALLILLIGFSRLYGGVHRPLDVLGGWAIGAVLLWAFYQGRIRLTRLLEDWSLGMRLVPAVLVPVLLLVIFRGESDLYAAMGAWMGMWAGSLVEERYVGYEPRHYGVLRLAVHAVLSVAILFGLRYGIKAILGPSDLANFARYILIGLSATLLSPWLFTRIPGSRVTANRTPTY